MDLNDSKMNFFEHLNELKIRLVWIFITVFGIAMFCFTFNLKTFNFKGYDLPKPVISTNNSIVVRIYCRMVRDLVPNNVEFIVTTPTEALIARLEISIFLGIILGMPIIIYQLGRFVSPGLYPRERKMIAWYAVPATLLFALGCAFSYFLITPFTMKFLYEFVPTMGAKSFLSVNSFISFVLLFSFAFGLGFELPILMVGLTHLGVIPSKFWKENWRYAVIAIVIFAGFITPDTSGITQLMLSAPMVLLYGLGYLVSIFVEKKRKKSITP